MSTRFVHLHNHSHYSLQDAACKVPDLLKTTKDFGMDSVALTDHGVMYGIPEFVKKAKNYNIKPIVGMEAYITLEGTRFERGGDGQGRAKKKPYDHLILIAKNLQGYQNLIKLSSIGFLEGFYYRPRIDLDALRQHHEGIICSSACLGGIVSKHLVNGNYDRAREVSVIFQEIFEDDFYLEIQDHRLEDDKAVLEGVPKLSRELGIKMIATNDVHYLKKEHAVAHNILVSLGDKSGNFNYKQLRYGTDEIYYKSQEQMIELFSQYEGAIENTLEIRDKVDLVFGKTVNHFPKFPIPPESKSATAEEYFEELCRERLPKRYPNPTPEVMERFEFELETIKKMGFPGYFLVVQDFINAAKERGIAVGPGRGSAAGSIIAYILGITNVEPLQYGLLFERFLNPARVSMPDIDVDFADDRRGEAIQYVKEKYGSDAVCQIITFGTLSSKAVLTDVGRVLNVPLNRVKEITKHIPSDFGKVYSLDKAVEEVQELKQYKNADDPLIKEMFEYGHILEGMNRNSGKHAAGVVIAPGPVSDYVPLSVPGAGDKDVVTQYNMKELEDFGLLKMDFLGLATIGIIEEARRLIKKNHGVNLDMDAIPVDDKKTFDLFAKGQTTAIFQFESPGMREYLRRLKPESIKDLSAMNALYRPGPMEFIGDFIDRKFGRKKVEYRHPLLEPILKETYGVLVYQEQVIQIANKVMGLTLAQADVLRRAMGKKDEKAMQDNREKFVNGAIEQGVGKAIGELIFEDILKFANYGFNKSHAVAYSIVAYQTAYLKAHYTPEFLAANLTHELKNMDKITPLLEDCRKLGIPVLPPDVNAPSVHFDVIKGKIKFGLSAIKGTGEKAIEEIKSKREKLGRDFTSLFDFCSNVDLRIVNKRVVESLIIAGAFDSIDKERAKLFANVEFAIDFGARAQKEVEHTSGGLFADIEEEAIIPEPPYHAAEPWSETVMLSREREYVGFYVTGHPLRKLEIEARSFTEVDLSDSEKNWPEYIRVAAVVTDCEYKLDKKGDQMCFFQLNTLQGSAESLMYSSIYTKYGSAIADNNLVVATAKWEIKGDGVGLQVVEAIPLEQAASSLTKFIKITADKTPDLIKKIDKLKALAQKNSGEYYIYLGLRTDEEGLRVFRLDSVKVSLSSALLSKLSSIFGQDEVVLQPKPIQVQNDRRQNYRKNGN